MKLLTPRVALAVALAASSSLPELAWAHARLVRSDPAAGASLATPPATVSLWFDQPLEAAYVRITLSDAAGRPVTDTAPRVDPDDPKRFLIDVPRLPPGEYRVSFEGLAIDGHRVKSRFPFTVKTPAAP